MQRYLKKTGRDLLATTLLLGIFLLTVTHIMLVSEAIQKALYLCAKALIPTLFPFLILTDLLLSTEGSEKLLTVISTPISRLLRLSKSGGVVFLLGAIFGFPMGAKAIARYYPEGRLSKEEAERLLLFSGNASPFFLIGSVGAGMLSSPQAGIMLYLLQLFVSLGCGTFLGCFAKHTSNNDVAFSRSTFKISFPRSVQGAVKQILFISGYVVFFSAILSVLLPYLSHPFLKQLCSSLFEISNACAAASTRTTLILPFCAFSACFSGVCVYFQTLDCIEGCGLNTKRYLPTKLLCGVLAFFLALLLPDFH